MWIGNIAGLQRAQPDEVTGTAHTTIPLGCIHLLH